MYFESLILLKVEQLISFCLVWLAGSSFLESNERKMLVKYLVQFKKFSDFAEEMYQMV